MDQDVATIWKLLTLVVLLQVLDYQLSVLIFITIPGSFEVNPLISKMIELYGYDGILYSKIIASTLLAGVTYIITRNPEYHQSTIFSYQVIAGLYVFVNVYSIKTEEI